MNSSTREQIGNRTLIVTIVMNAVLTLIKIVIGFIGHSASMISDGVHSLSDIISSIGVLMDLGSLKNLPIALIRMVMRNLSPF